ncbi:hypothetical protein F5Y05DRAFT_21474 [Hypoxylon sp. FL0543]|nr:hypothetical protein F5Y05DRAFT_21474 [Hypoxylon sp. FL0543]
MPGKGHTNSSKAFAQMEYDPLEQWPAAERESERQNGAAQVHEVQESQAQKSGSNKNYEDAAPDSQPPPNKSIKLISIWWLEAISCLLVIVMVAALVGTVQPYQGQPLPQWPYSLSINTIVAFYSEVMRAAMILVLGQCLSQLKWSWFTRPRPLDHMEHYDNASRGPWGSVGLLWAIRLKAVLPSLGAIMMILSLLVVPFTQQIVQFYPCTFPDAKLNASIPKTNYAHAGVSHHIGAALSSIDPKVQALMNLGIYDDEPQQVSPNCQTGNCTFDEVYHTCGWCAACEDISDQLEIIAAGGEYGPNFTLPSSNLSAAAGDRTFVMGMGGKGIQAIRAGFLANETDVNATSNFEPSAWSSRGYGAAQCTLDPCIRSYTSEVKGGNLTEILVNTTSQAWSQNQTWYGAIDVSCLNAAEEQALRKAGYKFDRKTTPWLGYNLSAVAQDAFNPTVFNDTSTTIRPECIYQTDYIQVNSLLEYFITLFTGQVTYGTYVDGPAILQTIFAEGNVTFASVDGAFNRLAQALTVWTREHDGGNATGLVYKSDTCVDARWGWIAYPLALVLGTIIFLMWTIDHTRKNAGSRQDYKSSPLALLFHRLGGVGTEGLTSDITSSGELQKKAKGMRVVFQGTDDVWRFTEVDRDHTYETDKQSGSISS